MARPIPKSRFEDLVECATRVFIYSGYRRTQMADVAGEMGIAKGSLYTYVESKEALFDLLIRCADRDDWRIAIPELPVRTPATGSTLGYIREQLVQRRSLTALSEALKKKRVRDAAPEVRSIVTELYDVLAENRYGVTLVERSSRDYPELAAIWLDARSELLMLLQSYLESRTAAGSLKSVPDTVVAARFILEAATFWAIHRHSDLQPEPVSDSTARDTVVQFVVDALVKP